MPVEHQPPEAIADDEDDDTAQNAAAERELRHRRGGRGPLIARGEVAVNVWWLIAAPAAFAAVSLVSAWQARRRGFERPGWRLVALGAASFAAGWLACLVIARAAHWPAGLGWTVAVAAGYLAWSWFACSRPTAIVAVALAAVGVTLVLASAPSWGVQLGVGIAMVIGGLVLRSGPEA